MMKYVHIPYSANFVALLNDVKEIAEWHKSAYFIKFIDESSTTGKAVREKNIYLQNRCAEIVMQCIPNEKDRQDYYATEIVNWLLRSFKAGESESCAIKNLQKQIPWRMTQYVIDGYTEPMTDSEFVKYLLGE